MPPYILCTSMSSHRDYSSGARN